MRVAGCGLTPSRSAAATVADLLVEIASRIRAQRMDKGLTQADLADATGLSRGSIANIEVGTQMVQIPALAKIAGVPGCSIAELLGEGDLPEVPRVLVTTVSSVTCERCGPIGDELPQTAAYALRNGHVRDHLNEKRATADLPRIVVSDRLPPGVAAMVVGTPKDASEEPDPQRRWDGRAVVLRDEEN